MENQIPSSFYYVMGVLILSNVGTLIGLIVYGVKFVWFLSDMNSRIKSAHAAANRAHVRIDKLEE